MRQAILSWKASNKNKLYWLTLRLEVLVDDDGTCVRLLRTHRNTLDASYVLLEQYKIISVCAISITNEGAIMCLCGLDKRDREGC